MVPGRQLNILLLDDDPSITRLLAKVLRREFGEDSTITALNDPVAARDWLAGNCCDILVTDLEMPDFDGVDMLRFVKHTNAWTQVIFITGNSTWDALTEALEYGASDYLLKPIDQQELLALVRQAKDRYSRWRLAAHGTFRTQRTASA